MVDSSRLLTNFTFSVPCIVIHISVHKSPNFLFNRKFYYPCNKRQSLIPFQRSVLRVTWRAGYCHASHESKFVTDVQHKIFDGRAVTGISHRMFRNKNRQMFWEFEMNRLQSTVIAFCYKLLIRGDWQKIWGVKCRRFSAVTCVWEKVFTARQKIEW